MTQVCMMPSSHMSAYTCEGVAGEEQQDQKRKQWHSVEMCGKQLKNPAETARRSHCGTDLKCDWTLQATRISRVLECRNEQPLLENAVLISCMFASKHHSDGEVREEDPVSQSLQRSRICSVASSAQMGQQPDKTRTHEGRILPLLCISSMWGTPAGRSCVIELA
ncbi:uncharacterized protein [Engystomops pustulosus]